jgi:hypothetical protein
MVLAGAQETNLVRFEGKADLVIEEVWTVPDPLIAGQNYGVHFMIKNYGGAAVKDNFWVELSGSTNKPFRLQIRDGIGPGETKEYAFESVPSFTETGSHQITLRVDSHSEDPKLDDLIDELNENNNVETRTVSVESEALGIRGNIGGILEDRGIEVKDLGAIKRDLLLDGGGGVSDNEGVGTGLLFMLMLVVLVVAILLIIVYLIRGRRGPEAISTESTPELEKLQKEKGEIEEMIRIAKVKFYKRKLDEESYKEIVKDNQEKLIRIEAKISELEGRVKKLERNQ